MQINDNHSVLDRVTYSVQSNREYQIDKAIYTVNRVFDVNKTLKEILFQKITSEYRSVMN